MDGKSVAVAQGTMGGYSSSKSGNFLIGQRSYLQHVSSFFFKTILVLCQGCLAGAIVMDTPDITEISDRDIGLFSTFPIFSQDKIIPSML